ncbi:MAG: HEPN domain-containing protein [Actinomycetota bacterium]|nr:HEPN domain-containing protein [Actinomycetota bacterium]
MDEALRELVDGWLAKAETDWKAAGRLEPGDDEEDYDPVYYNVAAFHLQQAAEKTLKAFLARHSVAFMKTHHLDKLLGLAATVDVGFDSLADAAETLAPFAVEVRYPGDWDELSRDEYVEARQAAEKITETVMERMGDPGVG